MKKFDIAMNIGKMVAAVMILATIMMLLTWETCELYNGYTLAYLRVLTHACNGFLIADLVIVVPVFSYTFYKWLNK